MTFRRLKEIRDCLFSFRQQQCPDRAASSSATRRTRWPRMETVRTY